MLLHLISANTSFDSCIILYILASHYLLLSFGTSDNMGKAWLSFDVYVHTVTLRVGAKEMYFD